MYALDDVTMHAVKVREYYLCGFGWRKL
jgi:hypothetical protein